MGPPSHVDAVLTPRGPDPHSGPHPLCERPPHSCSGPPGPLPMQGQRPTLFHLPLMASGQNFLKRKGKGELIFSDSDSIPSFSFVHTSSILWQLQHPLGLLSPPGQKSPGCVPPGLRASYLIPVPSVTVWSSPSAEALWFCWKM